MNPYKILRISNDATIQEIKKAYKKRSKETHPDTGGTEQEFTLVKDAYDILSNPLRRKEYDATGNISGQPNPENYINDISSLFFNILTHNSKAEDIDLVQYMIIDINQIISKLNESIIKCDEVISFLNKFKNKITKKEEGENIFEELLTGRVFEINNDKTRLLNDLKKFEKIKELVNQYECKKDSAPKGEFIISIPTTTI